MEIDICKLLVHKLNEQFAQTVEIFLLASLMQTYATVMLEVWTKSFIFLHNYKFD